MCLVVTNLRQANVLVVMKTALFPRCGIQSKTGMSGSELSVSASVLNQRTGTICEVDIRREREATFMSELVENTYGLVEVLSLPGRSNPPGKV